MTRHQNKIEELYEKFISSYKKADKKKRLWMYIGIYTLFFAIAFLLAYSPILLGGKTFVNAADGRGQHLPILVYVGRTLRHFIINLATGDISFQLFDLSMRSGDDVIGFLHSSSGTDPLLLLSVFVPTRYSEYLYAFLAVFRVYLAGLSFSYMCFYFKKRALHTLIGSMVYCFSGYAFSCSMIHPYFDNPLVFLPLLIAGLDKIIKKERPYLFILAVFYTALCSYYHLYMVTVMLLIYGACRFFDIYKTDRLKEFLLAVKRGAAAYALGIGSCAMVFLPSALVFLNASRSTYHNFWNYSWKHTLWLFLQLICPPGSWDSMAFAAITAFALLLLFFSKRRRTLKALMFGALAFLTLSWGGMLMNGFQYPSNRWTFGVALIAAYVVVEMLPELLNMSRKQQIVCLAILIIYTTVVISTEFGRNIKNFLVGIIFMALTFLALNITLQKKTEETEKNDSEKETFPWREAICLFLVVINVGVNGIYTLKQVWFSRQFQKFGYEVARLQGATVRELEQILLKNPLGRGDGTGFIVNTSMVWQVPDMLIYSSITDKNIIEFWDQIEGCGRYQFFHLYSTDQRTIVNTLFSSRYQVESARTTDYVPYGYKESKRTEKGNVIYENDYALPWGYTYSQAISYKALENLHGLERQEAMLQAIALEEVPASQRETGKLNFDEKRLPYTVQTTNCQWKDGKLIAKQANAGITLNFTMPPEMEGYVRLKGFDINDTGLGEFMVSVNSGNVVKKVRVTSRLNNLYDGRKNYLFNLGYSDKVRRSATITFPRPGTFKLKDIELYALPFTNYPARVNALRAEPLKNIKWGTNELTGTVDLTKDKILCVSVPYSKGWSATVDGKEEKILRGNYMFMALPLKAGHHDIVFSYCPPGLKIGAALTVLSWGILAWMLLRERRRKNRERTA